MTTRVAGGFTWSESAGGPMLSSDALQIIAPHVFTSRALTFVGDRASDDWRRLASALGLAPEDVVRLTQVHGRAVQVVRPGDVPGAQAEADAVISLDPSRGVAVRVADCVPILLADRRGRAIAAVHAGWRGACAGVVSATVERLDEHGVPARDLVAVIGPSIGPCCYQVDDRVRGAFLAMTPEAATWFAPDGAGHWRLDLWQAVVDQLTHAGLAAEGIAESRVCTAEHLDLCYSYRREGAGTGRLVAAIRLPVQ